MLSHMSLQHDAREMCQECLSGIPLILTSEYACTCKKHLQQGRIHAPLHPCYILLSHVHDGKSYNISCLPTNLRDAEQCTALQLTPSACNSSSGADVSPCQTFCSQLIMQRRQVQRGKHWLHVTIPMKQQATNSRSNAFVSSLTRWDHLRRCRCGNLPRLAAHPSVLQWKRSTREALP